MKRSIAYAIFIIMLSGCSKNDGNSGNSPQPPAAQVSKIQITANKTSFIAYSQDSVIINVKVFDKNDIVLPITDYSIYVNGSIYGSTTFKTSASGSYSIKAVRNGIESNTIVIDAAHPSTLIKTITLTSNTQLTIADGKSAATFTVKMLDANNQVLTGINYEIVENINKLTSNTFTTNQPGTYSFVAKTGVVQSNSLTVEARVNTTYSDISIPVIFHIVHFGEVIGTGSNLSSTQVNTLLAKLNTAFANQLTSTIIDPNAVDTKIRFRLAVLDKNGASLAEPGIFRVNGTPYDDGGRPTGGPDIANDKQIGPNEKGMMVDHYFNPSQYLNIWIGPTQYGESAATLPFVGASNPLGGLINVPDNFVYTVGNPYLSDPVQSCFVNTSGALNNKHILAHEVGHVLGLIHPMSTNNCVSSDYCADTYSYIFGRVDQPCDGNRGLLSSSNIMDYAGVNTTFTYDQSVRMRHVFNYGLWLKDLKNSTK